MGTIDIGKMGRTYLGIEAVAGTAIAASVLLPLNAPTSIQEKHTPNPVEISSGRRHSQRSSVMGKRWSEGDLELNLDAVNAGYLMKLTMGNEINTNVTGTVYDHNFYPTVSGNTPLTATIYASRGVSTDIIRVAYAAAKSTEINFDDGLATIKTSVLGAFPIDGATEPTTLVASGTVFTFRDASVKFGATIIAAEAGSATPVKSFSVTYDNDTEAIFRSGAGDVDTIRSKGLKVSGKYAVYFDDIVERNKYRALQKKALTVTFTGITIAVGYAEYAKLRFAQVALSESDINTGLDDFYVVTGSFTAEEDVAQVPNVCDMIVRNNKSSVY